MKADLTVRSDKAMKNRALDDGGPSVQEVSCRTAVSKLDYCQTYQQVLSEVKISLVRVLKAKRGQRKQKKIQSSVIECTIIWR